MINLLYSNFRYIQTQSLNNRPLILDLPIVLRGLSDVIKRYDAVLFDQFGVLHDGINPIPNAIDVMNKVKELGKPVIILSNTSKRKSYVINNLRKLGFPEVDGVVCSGELSWEYIKNNHKGKNCCWLTWSDNKRRKESWMEGLEINLSSVENVIILNIFFLLLYVCL